jgi:hypothetical protein
MGRVSFGLEGFDLMPTPGEAAAAISMGPAAQIEMYRIGLGRLACIV